MDGSGRRNAHKTTRLGALCILLAVQVAAAQAGSTANVLTEILLRHWPTAAHTAHLEADIRTLAGYYAQFPGAVALLHELDEERWRIEYAPGHCATRVRAAHNRVAGITVLYDPRSGARVRRHPQCIEAGRCSISAADALLHELLHVQALTTSTANVLETIGPLRWSGAHEHTILKLERRLFTAMSQYDRRARPQRRRHAGELKPVACPVCLPEPGSAEARHKQQKTF